VFKYLILLIILLTISSCGKDKTSTNDFTEDENTDYLVEEFDYNGKGVMNDSPDFLLKDIIDKEEEVNVTSLLDKYNNIKTSQRCGEYLTLNEILEYGFIVQKLGGKIKDPSIYKKTMSGLQDFLNETGIKNFTAYEISHPGNMKRAKSCGIKNLIPPRGCWLRTAALSLLAENIRNELKQKVKINSHYRTKCYNKKLGGSKRSEHLEARSIDLSYQSPEFRKIAMNYMCKNFWKDDVFGLTGIKNSKLNFSIGIGYKYTHIGLGSKNGRRYWLYKSFVENEPLPKDCWTKSLVW